MTSNGRLDQRVWLKNDILEDLFEIGVHTLRRVTTDTPRHWEKKHQLHRYICGEVNAFGIPVLVLYS